MNALEHIKKENLTAQQLIGKHCHMINPINDLFKGRLRIISLITFDSQKTGRVPGARVVSDYISRKCPTGTQPVALSEIEIDD